MQLTPFANSNARRKIVKSFHKEMIFFSARHPQGGTRQHTAALFHMSALCVVGRSGSSPRTEQRNLRNYELNWLGSLQAEFSGRVHNEGILNYTDVLTGAFSQLQNNIRFNTPDGKTNIGRALMWAYENIRSAERGKRLQVRDVVIRATDTSSDDGIVQPSKLWRDQGTILYVQAFRDGEGNYLNYDQMLEITADPDLIFYIGDNFAEAGMRMFNDTISHLCVNIFDHVSHDLH
ncbi:unnamed protein product [Clavelina lepadiformis]|uniref:VWFA domain-containing protein n=1 Tax=Clavelina lepadiformis TaxID=159417 RepID=A0ABP0EYZ5_CLALP